METRNLITGIVVALLVYVVYMTIYTKFVKPALPQPPAPVPGASGDGAAATTQQPTSGASSGAIFSAPTTAMEWTGGETADAIVLGGDQDALRLVLAPRGAAVERLDLTERRGGKRYEYRESADADQPYPMIRPVERADAAPFAALATSSLRVGGVEFALDQVLWRAERVDAHNAVFSATLRSADGDVLRVTKTYVVASGQRLFDVLLRVENLTERPLRVQLRQIGPTGIPEEGRQFPSRRIATVYRTSADSVLHPRTFMRSELAAPEPKRVTPPTDGAKFFWTAATNKYFGVFMRPIAADGSPGEFVVDVAAHAATSETKDVGDAFVKLTLAETDITPKGRIDYRFQLYAGPKNTDALSAVDKTFADRTGVGYLIAQDLDMSCSCSCCAPAWLTLIMKGSLESLQFVSRNFGIAIILLVIIIRTLLHPLAVYQQKTMYRYQEQMAKLQPKMEAIRAQHPNDQMAVNREMMTLYRDSGVSMLTPLLGMIPLMIQLPILGALWNALNTDVHLRHAIFDGVWIRDLSAPDALVRFSSPITIPLLGWLPWIGTPFQNVPSINLLPILMGVSMYLQQKYMPKPNIAKPPSTTPARPGAMSMEDQMRQTQMMANMMSFIFPIMLYYQPSGLNLYWMATNVFGICESLLIRKQIERDKLRRAAEGDKPVKVKPPGPIRRWLAELAKKAEEIQKRADQVSRDSGKGKKDKR